MAIIKILLVDDHEVLRRGLALLLDAQENFKVIADFSTGEEAIAFAKQQQPDIVVTDISMPGMNGIELIKSFAALFPQIPTLVLSMHLDEQHILDAVDAGAKGYLVKDTKEDTIIQAVQIVAAGKMYLMPEVSEVLTKSMLQGKREVEVRESFNLTNREKEILQCIVDGLSNKMIGSELDISERTVNAHRYNVMRKLNAHNTADLVRIALNEKLLV